MMNNLLLPLRQAARFDQALSRLFNNLQPLALLAARLYVGWVFFASGLTKIDDWETTLFLFELEYAVPLLSPEVAAWLGTAGELILPVLLFAGLLTRFSALGLSVVNVVAVISLAEIAPAALALHILWGVILGINILWGAGKLSLDSLLSS
ncbi:DoxX family protein [Parendozoicomonas haliclonae]|uniref:DoxX n=1 Tax=Parendozoicomonas haliclonae TaxID=1960125 RepID=A0A1X7AL12_9GAMM|nr:DoxX family protein [Parendozoicomonas haliclonae]SMA48478.1 DoxX [Parendozoicomonas haliclonae]